MSSSAASTLLATIPNVVDDRTHSSFTTSLILMRVLVLCKRQYTGRDLLDDRYGRLYEIPEALAARGHDVHGLAISYRRRGNDRLVSEAGVNWRSINLLPYGMSTRRLTAASPIPNVIWAGSDIPMCLAGVALARRMKVPVVLDLYDNYESFGLSRLPGLKPKFRQACADAQGITVVTHTLADHIQAMHTEPLPITVVGNGVNADVFAPRDKMESRVRLGLPRHAQIIGCAGALDQSRGISDLFEAFMRMTEQHPTLHLAVAGPRDASLDRYRHPRIIDMGVLDWQQIPAFLSSLDVSVVCNRDSDFGRYCYPLKLVESLHCQVPVVAAAVGEVPRLLEYAPGALYPPGDPVALAERIAAILDSGSAPYTTAPPKKWQDLAADVEHALSDALTR